MLNGWNNTVRTTSAINSASMMTLTVSHQPSSFLAGVMAASAGFRLGSIIRVNTPFLVSSGNRPVRAGRASYTRAVSLRQALAGDAKNWRKKGRGPRSRDKKQGAAGFALLEGDMSVGGFGEAPLPADLDLHFAALDDAEQLARHFLGPPAIRHK